MGTKERWKYLIRNYNEELNEELLQQHHAAQFIALVGKYLVEVKEDDSNTNMRSMAKGDLLVGKEFDQQYRVALDLSSYKLLVLTKDNIPQNQLELLDKSKKQVFNELKQLLRDLGVNVSEFQEVLHYEMPAHNLDKGESFTAYEEKFVQENILYRNNAEVVLTEIASGFDKAEPVRIWPHHFDTGSYIPLTSNKDGGVSKSISIGWAIPDLMVKEPYYYISYWSEDELTDFKELPKIKEGEWEKSGWHGGILKLSDLLTKTTAEEQHEMAKVFLSSGIEILTNCYL